MLSFKKSKSTNKSNGQRGKTRLSPESLEDRKMMTVNFWAQPAIPEIEYDSQAQTVEITGSYLNDNVSVSILDNGTDSPEDDLVKVRASNPLGSRELFVHRVTPTGEEVDILFMGNNGNDRFRNGTSLESRAYGGAGNDSLLGGSNVDRLFGGWGNDLLNGAGGNDYLYGNGGNDQIYGMNGDDYANGGSGNDNILGGLGDDELRGGSGDDTIRGSRGDDEIIGGSGEDYLNGGFDNDLILGGRDADEIHGGSGSDTMMGEDGKDDIYGGAGRDLMHGGDGNDDLFGGSEGDVMIGGDGTDYLYGQGGDDHLVAGDVDINPQERLYAYSPVSVFWYSVPTEDDDTDYMQGGTGSDRFVIADFGSLNFDKDIVLDAESQDSFQYIHDPWGAQYPEYGTPDLSEVGHKAE